MGAIYILTNPSFPQYVKIGYADDVKRRLSELNRSECIPFAFRIFATYEVDSRLSDLKVHNMIDRLNPNLRSIDVFNGQKRVREFYAMDPEDAYAIFETMAEIHKCPEKLRRNDMNESAEEDVKAAEEIDREYTERAPNFKFEMCGIKIGERIQYYDDPSIEITVISSNRVLYDGQEYSLTGLASLLTGQKNSAGPGCFKYKDRWLNEWRHDNGY